MTCMWGLPRRLRCARRLAMTVNFSTSFSNFEIRNSKFAMPPNGISDINDGNEENETTG